MTTREGPKTSFVSLVPYLQGTPSGFHLRPLAGNKISYHPEGEDFCFRTVPGSDPIAKVIEAYIETDAKREIKKVFMVIQRDEYLFRKDDLTPLTNPDIDRCWQRAFSFHLSNPDVGKIFPLSSQLPGIGGNDTNMDHGELTGLIPFQSLFYCKKRDLFFHPPCPLCGAPLQLCMDDHILSEAGLAPYSTTLERHLFCPSCLHEGPIFYALRGTAAPCVRDLNELVWEFRRIIEGDLLEDNFPCKTCDMADECFHDREKGKVFARLLPFSFYPFHMMLMEAMSMNAASFLPLLSGASSGYARSSTGQAPDPYEGDEFPSSPFLFEHDTRYFMEILYLKLTFLEDLIRLLAGNQDKAPLFLSDMNRIWITLPEQKSLLPYLWNFKVKLIDVADMADEDHLLNGLPRLTRMEFLGRLWFQTLLANRIQGKKDIFSAVKRVLKEKSYQDMINIIGEDRIFGPENIFYDPSGDEISMNRAWKDLWYQSIALGFSLVSPGLLSPGGQKAWDTEPDLETFTKEIERLRDKAHSFLFPPEYTGAVEKGEADLEEVEEKDGHEPGPDEMKQAQDLSMDESAKIIEILRKIYERWKTRADIQGISTERPFPSQEGGITTLSRESKERDDDLLEETVIISPETLKALSSGQGVEETKPGKSPREKGVDKTEKPMLDEYLEETVIISAKGDSPKEQETDAFTDDSLEETVIIDPGKRPPSIKHRHATSSPGLKKQGHESPAGEVNTYSPLDQKEKDLKKKKPREEDLEETIIINPLHDR